MRELFQISKPTHIWYSDSPPLLGGIPYQLSVSDFQERMKGGYHYTENLHADNLDELGINAVSGASGFEAEVERRLLNPATDKLVVAYMGEEVGHGLFAREAFEIGEIIALYTGELTLPHGDSFNVYTMDYSPYKGGKKTVIVDAGKMGGLARFMQHLPFSPDLLFNQIRKDFARNPSLIEPFIRKIVADTQDVPEQAIQKFVLDVRKGLASGDLSNLKNLLNYKVEELEKNWEVRSLAFESTTPEKVAWSNVTMQTVFIRNIPIRCLIAECSIPKGAQLGFPYGLGYWMAANQLPVLFGVQGEIIPRDAYQFTRVPIRYYFRGKAKGAFYPMARYKEDQEERFPVQIDLATSSVSFFHLRKTLVQHRILTQEYMPIDSSNPLVLALQKVLPQDISFELYNRYPRAKKLDQASSEQPSIIDLVITAKTMQHWTQLTYFFRASLIANQCKCFQQTKEILINEVNLHQDLFLKFMEFLRTQRSMVALHFATLIPEQFLPPETPEDLSEEVTNADASKSAAAAAAVSFKPFKR